MINQTENMVTWILFLSWIPILGSILTYIIKLERRMAIVTTDVQWIKKIMKSRETTQGAKHKKEVRECQQL